MGWRKKSTLAVRVCPERKTGNPKRTIPLAFTIGLGVGTVLLGMITMWLLLLQDMMH